MASVENLSSATISYGVQTDDGSTTYFGDEPATIADDGSGLVSGFYDLTVLHISDGVDTATAYISLSTDDETAAGYGLEVPMAYFPPEWVDGDPYEDVVLSITVDGEGTIVDETYFAVDPETGATGELYAEPEGIVVPQVPIVEADGNVVVEPDVRRRPVRRSTQPHLSLRAARTRNTGRRDPRGHRLRRQHRRHQRSRPGTLTRPRQEPSKGNSCPAT